MDELRESSLLFSLQSLMETERQRVQREAREAEMRNEDELRRTADAAERRLVAAAKQHEARQQRLTMDRDREQLENERIEALKRASIERVRIETDSTSRLLEAQQEREHLLKLAKIREDQRAARYRAVSWLSSGALLVLLASASLTYFVQLLPAQARQQERYEGLVSTERERAKVIDRALLAERSRSEALARQLTELRSAASTGVAQTPTSKSTLSQRGPGAPPSRPKPCSNSRDDGDPLNGSLIRCR